MENNRIDKVLIKEYLREIESVVKGIEGLNDIDSYRRDFEITFAKFIGTRCSTAVNSGTDALQLALLALGIGKGDSVILPDLTYISTGLVVKYVGAEPIIVDVKKEDLTIDEDKIEDRITPATKAIIAVHMFGHPCNMNKLKRICKKYGLYLIEDACQAFGSRYYGKNVGTFSDIAAFSFSYYKPVSSLGGNGGMLAFSHIQYLAGINKYLKLWQMDAGLMKADRKFNKMSLVDIATAKVKMRYIQHIFKARKQNKRFYEVGLSRLPGLRLFKDLPNTESVMENYVILTPQKEALFRHLKRNKIEVDPPYMPLHLSGLFKDNLRGGCDFSVSENYYRTALHLPLFSFMKEEECASVVSAVRRFSLNRNHAI
jgi:perosamine synthetase